MVPPAWAQLSRPIGRFARLASWIVVSIVFIGIIWWQGIPNEGDATFSLYTTWAIAHGHFACAYPPLVTRGVQGSWAPVTYIAPLYPLLAGGISALLHLGSGVAFPSSGLMGPHCDAALREMLLWALRADVATATVRIGLIVWVAVLASTVAFLRAVGRGATIWEPVTLFLLAISVPMLSAYFQYFHPQDVLALCCVLASLAALFNGRWLLAGIGMGAAIGANQYALLAGVGLFVLMSRRARWRFFLGVCVVTILLYAPFIIASGGRSWLLVAKGSGFNYSTGGTILWEMHLPSALMFAVSRFVPLGAAALVAGVARRHVDVHHQLGVVSLVTTCLALRLVFEANLWSYYFIPLAAMLLIMDVVAGRFRGPVIAWLMAEAIAFNPFFHFIAPDHKLQGIWIAIYGPVVLTLVGALIVGLRLMRRRVSGEWIAFFIVAAGSLVIGERIPGIHLYWWPTWLWQLVLVPSGVALAAQPLLRSHREALMSDGTPTGLATIT